MSEMYKAFATGSAIGGAVSSCYEVIAHGLDPPLGPNYFASCVFEMLVLVVDCLLMFLPATGDGAA